MERDAVRVARKDSGKLEHLFDKEAAEADDFLQSIGHTAGDWYVCN